MGNMEIDPKDIEADIQSNILMKAKNNVLELTKDLSKAETVVKMLDNEERFRMNKMFPQIKKKYGESFGLNNKDLSDVDITQFIRNEVKKGQSLITPTVEKAPAEEALPAEAPERRSICRSRTFTGNKSNCERFETIHKTNDRAW